MSTRRVLLVRHGQSTWNAERRWQGQADPPLTDAGLAQARSAIAAANGAGPFGGVASSTLERASRTAEILAEGLGLPTPTPEAGLMERSAGEWEGLTRVEIDQRYPGAVAAWRTPPGFESDDDLLARIVPALVGLAGTMPGDLPVLAVTHGG
ncbi:MAG: histidine phosphatase family protein, partial [Actinomycetota bacterium]